MARRGRPLEGKEPLDRRIVTMVSESDIGRLDRYVRERGLRGRSEGVRDILYLAFEVRKICDFMEANGLSVDDLNADFEAPAPEAAPEAEPAKKPRKPR